MPSDSDPGDGQGDATRRRKGLLGLFSNGNENGHGNGDAATSTDARGQAMRLRMAEFETMRVGDVMVPRAEVAAVEINTTFRDLIEAFAEKTVSRMPVYRENLDDPVGFIHLKDVVAAIASGETGDDDRPIETLKRDILFVPPSMRLHDLLVRMQTSRMHIALVIDEYGGTDGVVTLEDLVEQIVGDIEDEHDASMAHMLTERGRGVWEADARLEIEDFEAATGVDMALPDYEDEIDTLGGLAFALAGRVPQRGELIKHPSGVGIQIVDSDGRRIRKLRLRVPEDAKRAISGETASGEDSSEAK
jgi:magnesium and cobalt transporter